MKRPSSNPLLLLAVLACLACADQPPMMPPTTTMPASAPSVEKPSFTSTPTPTPTPTPTSLPVLVPRGSAIPTGRFLMKRADGLWLVSLTNPSEDRRLYSATSPWVFGGIAQGAGSLEVVVGERLQIEGKERTRVLVIRISDGSATQLFESDQLPRQDSSSSPRPIAVSPDGARIAYVSDAGFYLRDRRSNVERRLYQQEAGCRQPPSVPGCMYPVNPTWSPDGRWLFITGVNYEPLETYVFDASKAVAEISPGTVLRRCVGYDPAWRRATVFGDSGNCYSEARAPFFWYDPATGHVDVISTPAGPYIDPRPAIHRDGTFAILFYEYPKQDTIVFYDSDGALVRAFAVGFQAVRSLEWLPDGSGVVFGV